MNVNIMHHCMKRGWNINIGSRLIGEQLRLLKEQSLSDLGERRYMTRKKSSGPCHFVVCKEALTRGTVKHHRNRKASWLYALKEIVSLANKFD
jgi:hypothetical protein